MSTGWESTRKRGGGVGLRLRGWFVYGRTGCTGGGRAGDEDGPGCFSVGEESTREWVGGRWRERRAVLEVGVFVEGCLRWLATVVVRGWRGLGQGLLLLFLKGRGSRVMQGFGCRSTRRESGGAGSGIGLGLLKRRRRRALMRHRWREKI
jgi:hypothetical protein